MKGEARETCQVPGKLNIRIRTNKGQLAGHDLGHIDQATAAVTPHEAGADYKNYSSALLPAETLQACDRTVVRLQRAYICQQTFLRSHCLWVFLLDSWNVGTLSSRERFVFRELHTGSLDQNERWCQVPKTPRVR